MVAAIEREAEALGFVACGIAPADAAPEAAARLREWLARARMATWTGWRRAPISARAPAGLWPEVDR